MSLEYTITQDYYDYHDEQHDAKLEAKDSQGNVLGTLWFSVYHDEPAVKNIDVLPKYRRQGIGTALLKELQRLFPDQTIVPAGKRAAVHADRFYRTNIAQLFKMLFE